MNAPRYDKETVRRHIAGREGAIAASILGKPRRKNGGTVYFGRNSGSLAFETRGAKAGSWYDHAAGVGGDIFALVQHERGCAFPEALALVAELGGMAPEPTTFDPDESRRYERTRQRDREETQARADADRAAQNAESTAGALDLWDRAVDPRGTAVEAYLTGFGPEQRGLYLPDYVAGEAIRFVPAYRWRVSEDTFHTVPLMIALFRDIVSGEPVAVHRTAITAGGSGKAFGKQSKKMLGPVAGAAIMLSRFDQVEYGLSLCEGIETGLSVLIPDLDEQWFAPVWALGSAGAIGRFPLLSGLHSVTVLGENDEGLASLAAYEEVAARYDAAGKAGYWLDPKQDGDLADRAKMLRAAR